jgi:hypothetical protein
MNFSDLSNDPLGIGLITRAQDRRRNYAMGEGFGNGGFGGPLPDPAWDGFFQALSEKGVRGLADNSVGEAKGMFPESGSTVSTYDPSFQTSAVDTMPSNQLGTSGSGRMAGLGEPGPSIPSMDALLQKTTRARVKNPVGQRVIGQRGTNGSNISERG